MKFGDIGELAVLTLRNPDAAMRVLRGLDLPMVARWMALFLAVVLSRMLGVLLLMMLLVVSLLATLVLMLLVLFFLFPLPCKRPL